MEKMAVHEDVCKSNKMLAALKPTLNERHKDRVSLKRIEKSNLALFIYSPQWGCEDQSKAFGEMSNPVSLQPTVP